MRALPFPSIAFVTLVALTVGACRGPRDDAPHTPAIGVAADAAPGDRPAPPPEGSTTDAAPREDDGGAASAPRASIALMADEEVGPLIARLSESPGEFPSENYVTNETSLLHVADTLRDPRLEGRAYVGVGPEQNYTYVAILKPRIAYVVDIRRGNLLEHMFIRGCFETAATRAGFLTALLARRPVSDARGAGFAPLDAAFRSATADAELRDEGVARTKALLDRLHVARTASDDKQIARVHDAFAKFGLSIAYTMLNNDRKYPTLAENFAMKDPSGEPASFLASEEIYTRVRAMVRENRVIPIVGDFGGKHALRAVGDDMRARGVTLGVFYASNVEQYLFEQRTYGNFVASVGAMPHDEASRMIRVWFDAGKPHPRQQPKHRTTQLAFPVEAFLARAANKPFRYYWDVVTQPSE